MAPERSYQRPRQKRFAALGALLFATFTAATLTASAANATVMTASALPAAAQAPLHLASMRQIAHSAAPASGDFVENFVSVAEQRNIVLAQPITTDRARVPAGTRVSSYLVAISGANAGEIAFDTPVLAVIADETALADTSAQLGKAEFNYTSFNDVTAASRASFTTSGNTLRYNLDGASEDPVIVRVITAAVPEPGTWAMLIAGFGFIGALKRRQQRQILSA